MNDTQNLTYLGPCYIVGAPTPQNSSKQIHLVVQSQTSQGNTEAPVITQLIINPQPQISADQILYWERLISDSKEIKPLDELMSYLYSMGVVYSKNPSMELERIYRKAYQRKSYLTRKNEERR